MIFGAEYILKQVRRITGIGTENGVNKSGWDNSKAPKWYILHVLSTPFQMLHYCKFLC
jgi:hypothetical protein